MLIQSLVDHAQRHGDGDTLPRYYRNGTVRWVIKIDQQGKGALLGLAGADNKAGLPQACPSLARTSGIAPMLLVDTLEYVFALPKDDTAKAQTGAERRHDAYRKLLADWRDATDDPLAHTIVEFFDQGRHHGLLAEHLDSAKASDLVGVMVGQTWAHRSASAVDFWAEVARIRKSSGDEGICLACGKMGPLLKTVPDMVKGTLIPVGTDANGRPKQGRSAALVSVNTPAQGRGGTTQLANTPLCEDCGVQTVAALNRLLSDERHRRRGDDSVLTWWLREPGDFDLMVIDHPEPADVRALLAEPWRGRTGTALDTNAFYALTLSANQSRVVVRDWINIPVIEAKQHLAAWFRDHESTSRWQDGHHYVPLWQMVRASGRWDRGKNQYVSGSAIRGFERDLVRTALRGAPAPSYLIPRLLHRIRNDHHVDLARVALLRLALTRAPYQENVMPGLDETYDDVAYVWGRLFAVLEAIQRKALPDVNATIRDRYFGLAMTQPEATMRTLRTNANGHIKKLRRSKETRGAGNALDARLAEISELISPRNGLPAVLDAEGQTRFILGYDHQRAADLAAARAANEVKKNGDHPDDPSTTDQEPS